MNCRWVTGSRLTTFGRRVVITSAVFGLTTVGSAGVALAASDTVGFSPSAKVVKVAPMAVSVTFREPLRSSGAQMRVLTVDGDVGTGKVTTGQKTLRRALRLGAPQGQYTVEWKAVSAKGQKMTGSFTFFAARSNGEAEQAAPIPSPSTATEPTAGGPSGAGPSGAGPSGGESAGTAGPTASDAVEVDPTTGATIAPGPTVTIEATPTSEPSGTPEWISGSDPIWTPQPTAGQPTAGALSAGSGHSGSDRSVSTGFTAIPLAVGGLLVLAAGTVSLLNRPRLRD